MLNYDYYFARLKREVYCSIKKAYSNIFPYKGVKNTLLIVGAQRSGTNLLMDMLERSFQTDVYHERDSRAFDNYLMRPYPVIDDLKAKSKFPFFVVKGLCESHKTDELLMKMEPAKAIWVVRDYNDVINSMDISFKETKDIIKRAAIDKSAGGWRTEGMSDETYSLVKSLVHENISNKSASALQWYARNIIFFEKKFDTNKDVYLLNYNSLVADPEKNIEKICRFSGIQFDPKMFDMVNAGSVRKNKEPEIDEKIRGICFELWKRFDEIINA